MMSSLSAYLCTLFSPSSNCSVVWGLFDSLLSIISSSAIDSGGRTLLAIYWMSIDWMGRTLLAADWMGKTLLAVDWTGRTLQVWRSWISGHDSSNNMNWNWAKLASEDKFARGKRPNKPDTVSPVPIPQRKHTQQFTWPEENWSVYVSKSFC